MKPFLVILILLGQISFSAEIVTDAQKRRVPVCEEFSLLQELRVYKDPSLFLPQLSRIYADPRAGWEELMRESPLVTTLKGTVQLMKLGDEAEFKNFGAISQLYELVDPRFKPEKIVSKDKKNEVKEKNPLILPIKICSQDSYNDTMGFVLVSDLKRGVTDPSEHPALPPSGHPNPIPKLRKAPYWE